MYVVHNHNPRPRLPAPLPCPFVADHAEDADCYYVHRGGGQEETNGQRRLGRTMQRKLLEEGHHVLIFSQTCKMLNLLFSKAPSMPMMARQYNKAFSSDYVANGAAHDFKPKDLTPRAYSRPTQIERVKAKINRLSQTLANKALMSTLVDRGERIKKLIHELDEKLTVIESSPEVAGRKR